jgi:hypothetical protein
MFQFSMFIFIYMNTTQWPDAISEQKRKRIIQLIYERIGSSDEREEWLNELESASECDADEILNGLLNAYA